MNRLAVTIVDILGVLVPGAVFLGGCLLIPAPVAPIAALTTLVPPIQLLSNPWVMGGIWLATAYVLGLLIRLVSIRLMSIITLRVWSGRLAREAKALESILDTAVANPLLSDSLKELARGYEKSNPCHYAPYFHFAKRLIRQYPDMWAEAERSEAEIRFVAGLFLPLLLILLDGVLLCFYQPKAWVLIAVGALGAGVVVYSFPLRRTREVLYDQLLALIILLNPSQREQ
jgi:hypothetical protein